MSCFKFFVVFGLLLLCLLEPNFAEDAQRPSRGLQGQPLGPAGPQGSPMVLQRSARGLKGGALPPGLQRPPTRLQRSLLAGLQKPCPNVSARIADGCAKLTTGPAKITNGSKRLQIQHWIQERI
ncbi:hypothetical protein OS493_032452 [Desmophyllum pertusum]|uniref:Uncharacterized protein n=1 Tax=Desmophyllum pertusum TaxID=174260 RepID=A0A9X0D6J9_9CNID|nr:hypothetical protein OS493_032452 [Desmophyllum pertusum]